MANFILHHLSPEQESQTIHKYDRVLRDEEKKGIEQSIRQLFNGYVDTINQRHAETVSAEIRRVDIANITGLALRIFAREGGVLSPVLVAELSNLVKGRRHTVKLLIYRALVGEAGETVVYNPPEKLYAAATELLGYISWLIETGQVLPEVLEEVEEEDGGLEDFNSRVRDTFLSQYGFVPTVYDAAAERYRDAVHFIWGGESTDDTWSDEVIAQALMFGGYSEEEARMMAPDYFIALDQNGLSLSNLSPRVPLEYGKRYYVRPI